MDCKARELDFELKEDTGGEVSDLEMTESEMVDLLKANVRRLFRLRIQDVEYMSDYCLSFASVKIDNIIHDIYDVIMCDTAFCVELLKATRLVKFDNVYVEAIVIKYIQTNEFVLRGCLDEHGNIIGSN